MKLHISPLEMNDMFFYDIMMLYQRYEAYVKEENEQQEAQQKQMEEENDMDPKNMYKDMTSNMNRMMSNMGSMNFGSIPKF